MKEITESLLNRYRPLNEISISDRYNQLFDVLKKMVGVYVEPNSKKDHIRFHTSKKGVKMINDISITNKGYHYRGKTYDLKGVRQLVTKL